MNDASNIAYYYPPPYWRLREADWIKSLLLFFDRIAILLPGYMYGRHRTGDPTLAGPLEDMGLLEILEPAEWVDGEVTRRLADIVTGLVDDGAFDGLPEPEYFRELSASRVGYCADVELADSLIGKLRDKGLCEPSRDGGVSVRLHPTVRTTFLVLLAQLLRGAARRRGDVLHPATGDDEAIRDFAKVMSMDWAPSSSGVIEFDLEPAGIDLSAVPLDDLLRFREERGSAHRKYMLDLRRFMAEIASVVAWQRRPARIRARRGFGTHAENYRGPENRHLLFLPVRHSEKLRARLKILSSDIKRAGFFQPRTRETTSPATSGPGNRTEAGRRKGFHDDQLQQRLLLLFSSNSPPLAVSPEEIEVFKRYRPARVASRGSGPRASQAAVPASGKSRTCREAGSRRPGPP